MTSVAMPVVTLLFASLHGVLLMVLLAPISRHRHRHHISLGDGGDAVLLRKIRVHANFVEHVPMALLMLALLETCGLSRGWVTGLGAALLLARLLHAAGFLRRPGYSFGRFWGTALTWAVLLAMSVSGLWLGLRAIW